MVVVAGAPMPLIATGVNAVVVAAVPSRVMVAVHATEQYTLADSRKTDFAPLAGCCTVSFSAAPASVVVLIRVKRFSNRCALPVSANSRIRYLIP